MKSTPILLFAASLAFSGAALAAGSSSSGSSSKDVPGFNELDKNNDGSLSKAEAQGNPQLAQRFGEVDTNGDGKISRMEYLKTMAAKDFNTLREKTADLIEPGKSSSSSTGASSSSSGSSGSHDRK